MIPDNIPMQCRRRQSVVLSVMMLAGLLSLIPCHLHAQDTDATDTAQPTSAAGLVIEEIKPSAADPTIKRFDQPNYVIFDSKTTADHPLVVFMPGSGGKPHDAAHLLSVVAGQGYRVIGLEYNDLPAVIQVCPRAPYPNCSAAFRAKRIFGVDETNLIDNTPAESIVTRLVKLLEYLDQHEPDRQWHAYLQGSEPNWSRIVVSGLSQGAGMAAYIAKRERVARVVLFSSPWDFSGRAKALAPWISAASATPPEFWFAEYHRRENTARLLAESYDRLRIPTDHIRVLDLPLAEGAKPRGENPFHGSTIRNSGYADDWRFLFGSGSTVSQ